MSYSIRYARFDDCDAILRLLGQIRRLHQTLRPDIFREGTTKYTAEDLREIIKDESRPILIAADGDDTVLGYAMCVVKEQKGHSVVKDCRTLYLDDLCVDEAIRGGGIGKALTEECIALARDCGARRVELNVWECNAGAMAFYERHGFTTQKRTLELRL